MLTFHNAYVKIHKFYVRALFVSLLDQGEKEGKFLSMLYFKR